MALSFATSLKNELLVDIDEQDIINLCHSIFEDISSIVIENNCIQNSAYAKLVNLQFANQYPDKKKCELN